MEDYLCEAISQACSECHLDGGCCFEARPPLSQERIDILLKNGVQRMPWSLPDTRGYA